MNTADIVVSNVFQNRIYGAIFNDSRGKFVDGENVVSSPIQSFSFNSFGKLLSIQTLNTTYKVVTTPEVGN